MSDFGHVVGLVDGDLLWPHRFRDFPNQIDLQKTVCQGRIVNTDKIGELKPPFEAAVRYAHVQELLAFILIDILVAGDKQEILLGGYFDFVILETGDG